MPEGDPELEDEGMPDEIRESEWENDIEGDDDKEDE